MSNPFYNFIAGLLIDELKKMATSGDKFFLKLDHDDEVDALLNALSNHEKVSKSKYQLDSELSYEAVAFSAENAIVIVDGTANNTTPDFLVTLRNKVSDQMADWKNTALLNIISKDLDSIKGGSSDLQKKGMPFNSEMLKGDLKNKIENSNLVPHEKVILLDHLDNMLNINANDGYSLLDFKDVFEVLNKEEITNDDYEKISLFVDHDLEGKRARDIKKRLTDNRFLFEQVKRIHDFGNPEEELPKLFSEKGVKALKKDEWEKTSYSFIANSVDEKKSEDKNTRIYIDSIVVEGAVNWDKYTKDTAAGKRKRNILIFNEDSLTSLKMRIKFNITGGKIKSLNSDFLKITKGNESISEKNVKQKSIDLTLKCDPEKVIYFNLSYKHDNKAALGGDFRIAILPFEETLFEDIKLKYIVNPKKELIELTDDISELILGNGKEERREVSEYGQVLQLESQYNTTIVPKSAAYNDNEELKLSAIINSVKLDFLLTAELTESVPITAFNIWKMKRERQENFKYKDNKLMIGTNEYYTRPEYVQFLEWEKEWLEDDMYSGEILAGQLKEVDLVLHHELKDAYSHLTNHYKKYETLPTLCFHSEEFKSVATKFVNEYNKQIEIIGNEGSPKERVDLMKFCTLKNNDDFYLTSFHPLVIAYQLELNNQLGNENYQSNVLERLRMASLVPYTYDSDSEKLKVDEDHSLREWLKYKPSKNISLSETMNYLAKVVQDKMNQFQSHFNYLFLEESSAPFKLNIISISNDHQVLTGILNWMIEQINRNGIEHVREVQVSIYSDSVTDSAFDFFSKMKNALDIADRFNLDLKSKDYDEIDIIRVVREKLFFYKHSLQEEYAYAHLTFYKMGTDEIFAVEKVNEMDSGISLNGLLTSSATMKIEDGYQSGFGLKGYSEVDHSLLVETMKSQNELGANNKNKGNDEYLKNVSVVSRKNIETEKQLNKVFDSSHWITFVDPDVDLEFFQSFNDSLVVIHYSDQYSSSARYDAITVTNKSGQYFNVINNYLFSKELKVSDANIESAIKAFNAFNGEWLLRIIGSKGQFEREKLSILSGIKYCLAYFDHPDILWVPISLEEILRVAGAYGLDKQGGVFTAKNLGVSGSHSDDILFIGLEFTKDNIDIHFYPIEVKIGWNQTTVIEKARNQIHATSKLFKENLNYSDNNDNSFETKFYRQFFIQLFLSNYNKLLQSDFWNEKYQTIDDSVHAKLVNDEFNISSSLDSVIGKGCIVSFEKEGNPVSRADLDNQIMIMKFNEFDGTKGIVESIEAYRNKLLQGKLDLSSDHLLYNIYSSSEKKPVDDRLDTLETVEGSGETPTLETPEKTEITEIPETPIKSETDESNQPSIEEPINNVQSLENTRILIGKVSGTNREIYWEYGHKNLANRHLLISGKSGQGKTYFMQCILYELSKQNIPSIVVDYTEGFLPNQLENEFKNRLGEKIKQHIVFRDKLPINPFKQNEKNIGGILIEENETDVAERIKSVFSSVYSTLGVQQLNAIYEATQNGVKKLKNNMSLPQLGNELEALETNYAKTTLSQIRSFIDRNPFDSSVGEMDWSKIIQSSGDVNIIQLTGYSREVQLMITEFMLWDLWNYSVRNGDKNIPIPVVMDEAQNLDHRKDSPSARILTEGRKFGWSAWYATQFLKSQLGADELSRLQNSGQKIYFAPPESEVGSIANNLVNQNEDKKHWERKLSSLAKGKCVVHGPINQGGVLTNSIANVVDITPFEDRE